MELVIFIGLQASGKTSFYRRQFSSTHQLVSKDLMRHHPHRARRQQVLVESALRAGLSVVVDNTNPAAVDREPLIRLGKTMGATVVGYYFGSYVKECLERNRQRTGREHVPDVAIFATLKKLQPPTYSEGFDKLYYVRATAPSGFEVRDWQ